MKFLHANRRDTTTNTSNKVSIFNMKRKDGFPHLQGFEPATLFQNVYFQFLGPLPLEVAICSYVFSKPIVHMSGQENALRPGTFDTDSIESLNFQLLALSCYTPITSFQLTNISLDLQPAANFMLAGGLQLNCNKNHLQVAQSQTTKNHAF